MTSTQVLARLRRLLSDTDRTTTALDNTELLDILEDARRTMSVRKVTGMDALTISAGGISPDPTEVEGELLAVKAAFEYLSAEFRKKVSRGELGSSWSSGLEAESTITAGREYISAVNKLGMEIEELLLIKNSPSAGARLQ